jgi:methionyl-tRNA synthetase
VEIEDDSTDEAIAEAMGAVSATGCGYDSKESGSCEACGTSYAADDAEEVSGMTEEAGWSAKAASRSPKFVKIANLTEKQKGKFRSYWSNVWPKEFIDAVLDTEN